MAHQGDGPPAGHSPPPDPPAPAPAAGASRVLNRRRPNTPSADWHPAPPTSPTPWLSAAAAAQSTDRSAPQLAARQPSSLRGDALRLPQDCNPRATAAAAAEHQQPSSRHAPPTTAHAVQVRLHNLPRNMSAQDLAILLHGPPDIISCNFYTNPDSTFYEADITVRSDDDADCICDMLEDSLVRLGRGRIRAELLDRRPILLPLGDVSATGSSQHRRPPSSSSRPASSAPAPAPHSLPDTLPLVNNILRPSLPPPVGSFAAGGARAADRLGDAGKLLLTEQQADDADTDYILNHLASFAMETAPAPQRRATEPQIPIGPMASLSLNINTGLPPHRSSSSRKLARPAPASSSSLFVATSPRPAFQPRHPYPPMNPSDQNPPCNTLYVGNLPHDASEEELKTLFSTQRGYKRLCLRAKHNGPMCFVEFESISFATKSLHDLYGHPLHNSVKGGIRLSFSKNPLGVRSGQPPGQASSAAASAASSHPGHLPYGPGTANGFTAAQGPPPGLTAPSGLRAPRLPRPAPPAAPAVDAPVAPERRPWDNLGPPCGVTEAGTYRQRAPELWRAPNQPWNQQQRQPRPEASFARPPDAPQPAASPPSHPSSTHSDPVRPAGLSDGSQALPSLPWPAPISYWSSAYATAARNGNYGPIGPVARSTANARNNHNPQNDHQHDHRNNNQNNHQNNNQNNNNNNHNHNSSNNAHPLHHHTTAFPPNGTRASDRTDGLGGSTNATCGAPAAPQPPLCCQNRPPADRRNGVAAPSLPDDDWESVGSGEPSYEDIYDNAHPRPFDGSWAPP